MISVKIGENNKGLQSIYPKLMRNKSDGMIILALGLFEGELRLRGLILKPGSSILLPGSTSYFITTQFEDYNEDVILRNI